MSGIRQRRRTQEEKDYGRRDNLSPARFWDATAARQREYAKHDEVYNTSKKTKNKRVNKKRKKQKKAQHEQHLRNKFEQYVDCASNCLAQHSLKRFEQDVEQLLSDVRITFNGRKGQVNIINQLQAIIEPQRRQLEERVKD